MNTVCHTTFVIERELPASPKHAFRFFSEKALKERWNACHPSWTVLEDRFDFRVGGVEAKRWRTGDGHEQTFFAHYLDIVPPSRIIYAFDMTFRGERVSASLATIDVPDGTRTTLLFTEQLAFLAGREADARCESPARPGFDRLVEVVADGLHVGLP